MQRLYLLCTAYQAQLEWREALERGEDPAVAALSLAGLPEVSVMDAIEANRRLVEILLRWRRDAVLAARAAGSTWTAIGAALGTTKQRAHAWFRPTATP